jgi:hypothetical protein
MLLFSKSSSAFSFANVNLSGEEGGDPGDANLWSLGAVKIAA